jgi:ribosomal protein L21
VSAYAVIKTGGKQMRAVVDELIVVEKLVGEPGDVVEFDEVLLHADGSDVKVGAPTIADFKVWGEIEDQRRAPEELSPHQGPPPARDRGAHHRARRLCAGGQAARREGRSQDCDEGQGEGGRQGRA